MSKKRSCRRTTDENLIHDRAVKMRKMTDRQLNDYVDGEVEKTRTEGFNQGRASVQKIDIPSVMEEISRIKGIGEAKLGLIKAVLESEME